MLFSAALVNAARRKSCELNRFPVGANSDPTWRTALISHITTARTIGHPIDRIVILEHRDCGAYGHILGLKWPEVTPPYEEEKHREQVEKLVADLKKTFAKEIPNLVVDSLLLARDEDDALHIETTGP